MAEIFLDAGAAPGSTRAQILAAHDAAGDGAEAGGHMALLSAGRPGLHRDGDDLLQPPNLHRPDLDRIYQRAERLGRVGRAGDAVPRLRERA